MTAPKPRQQDNGLLWEKPTFLAALDDTPGTCRAIIRASLAAHNMAGLADDAATVTTEIAANAVRAMRAEADAGRLADQTPVIVLGAGYWAHGIRIEVWDKAPGVPVLREPDWAAESGRGLFIVNELTGGSWGCRPAGDGAKVVHADLEAA